MQNGCKSSVIDQGKKKLIKEFKGLLTFVSFKHISNERRNFQISQPSTG